jgi:hypothetical protein
VTRVALHAQEFPCAGRDLRTVETPVVYAGASRQEDLVRRFFAATIVAVMPFLASGAVSARDAAPFARPRVPYATATHPPQYPHLLERYGKARPPYEVPGVDYYVGLPAITLIDPTRPRSLPGCATYIPSSHAVSVTRSNCVLRGYDFRKGGGLQLQIPNGVANTTVDSSLFGLDGNPGFSTSLIDYRGAGLTVTDSTFLGPGQDPMYFDDGSSGTVTFERNYFFGISGDALDFGSTQTVIVQYNAFVAIGMNPASHPDAVQFCGGHLGPPSHESYNLLYQPVGVGNGGNQGIQVAVQCGGTIDGYEADHNVLVAPDPHDLTMSYGIASNGLNVKILDNYIDAEGSYGPIYPFPKGAGSAICRGNVARTAGSEYVGGVTYSWKAGQDIAGDFGEFTCE